MKTKEYGSNFHFEASNDYYLENNSSFFFRNDLALFLTGRAALFALVKYGIDNHKWKRIYFPSYYCHEVITPLNSLEIEICFYDINPFENKVDLKHVKDEPSSLLINVNYFGLFELDLSAFRNLIKIDDLTYNSAKINSSSAHYCFGSLRKEFPVSVGGFCFSLKELKIPACAQSDYGVKAHRDRLLAMTLKSLYLKTGVGKKDYFLHLFVQSENDLDDQEALVGMPLEAQVLLKSLNIKKIKEAKQQNLSLALSQIKLVDGVQMNMNRKDQGFGLIFYFEIPEKRNKVRSFLIKNSIYPAVLWPNQKTNFAQAIEKRVLFVHIDYRYEALDIKFIVDSINQSFYE